MFCFVLFVCLFSFLFWLRSDFDVYTTISTKPNAGSLDQCCVGTDQSVRTGGSGLGYQEPELTRSKIFIHIIYIHILPTLPTLCHFQMNNFIYIYTFYLHYQPFAIGIGCNWWCFLCECWETSLSTLKKQIIIYLGITLFTHKHFKSRSGHIQSVIIICQLL